MSEIRFDQRVLVLGSTGSGKSELLNVLFSRMAGGAQRALIDTKHEFAIDGASVATGDPDAIDWRSAIVHYRDGGGGPKEMQRLFTALHQRRRLVTCVHELSDVCDYHAGRTPPAFNSYVSKGRALGQGLLAGSQRPFEVPSRAKSEADHVFVFVPRFPLEQDHKAAAQAINMTPDALARALDQALGELGPHSFIHFDRAGGRTVICEPLSTAERSGIIVSRPVLY